MKEDSFILRLSHSSRGHAIVLVKRPRHLGGGLRCKALESFNLPVVSQVRGFQCGYFCGDLALEVANLVGNSEDAEEVDDDGEG